MRSQQAAGQEGEHKQRRQLPERLHAMETGWKITSPDHPGKAAVDTTLGNSFSMNSQTAFFLRTGIQPALQEVSHCASKEKASLMRYH